MNRRLLLVILFSWFLGNAGIYFLAPALPRLAEDFQVAAGVIPLVMSFFLVGKALGMLLWGFVSERVGRRPVFLGGLWLYVLSNGFAAVSVSLPQMLLARGLQGLAVGATLLMGRAMVNDSEPEAKAIARFGFLFSAGGVCIAFLPLLGSLLVGVYGWRGASLAMACYGLVLLLPARKITETRPSLEQKVCFTESLRKVFHNGYFVRILAVSALMMAGESAFNTSSAIVLMHTEGFSLAAFGGIKTLVLFAHIFGTLACAALSRYTDSDRLVGAGVSAFGLASVMALGAAWVSASILLTFLLPMLVYYFGTGFVVTAATAASVRPFPGRMALALGISLCFQFGFSALASFCCSLAGIENTWSLMGVVAASGILAMAVWFFPCRRVIATRNEV
ncbi:drug resistance transporter, Bcr/CflA [Legionella geestiana]|uniref:Drug resistance transporter, Bcr/CflA n=1 Tax=Legionella geestiana TaxID=45065 RepID=A0A0W0TGQ7_9GAMM|nr:MFS transporter [Legionella geestiana]KTC94742.1 drug resistance transporter, Bcr/CflA [Legionella geestiana]QBS12703.1 MFS transporter [Legionella geestiana]STX54831.1 drug resistance transporter, Bcr/CflA [Legionella geestiana]